MCARATLYEAADGIGVLLEGAFSFHAELELETRLEGLHLCNHRIMERSGVEGTFRGHLAHPPCSEQGHLQPDQAAQSPTQPGLECFQGWGISHLSGQPGPGFRHPQHNIFLPYIQS